MENERQLEEAEAGFGKMLRNEWQLEEAESRFREMLAESDEKGPIIIVKDGVKVGALLPFEHWRRLERRAGPDLKDVLLAPEPRTENLAPPRRAFTMRPPPILD